MSVKHKNSEDVADVFSVVVQNTTITSLYHSLSLVNKKICIAGKVVSDKRKADFLKKVTTSSEEYTVLPNGKKEGVYKLWYDFDRRGEKKYISVNSTYKDGKKEGIFQSWHGNGSKECEVSYKDDKEEGLYILWYDNGQKWEEVVFKDGKKEGLWQQWYENGKLSESIIYKNDIIDKRIYHSRHK